jgi:trk system potassium uptake protein TrkH
LTQVLRLRAARRIAVDVPAALHLVGVLVRYLSPAFVVPAAVAVGYRESFWPFLAAGAVTFAAGSVLARSTRGRENIGSREGFLVVALLWLLVAGFGALPYLFSGEEQLSSPLDAYYESMSGFTTTGASVLTDIEGIDRSLLLWRQFTTWVGGMGIIVLALAVLPRLRVGGRQLSEAEASRPTTESLTVTIRDTARRFLIIYFALTAAEVCVLLAIGWLGLDRELGPFDAVTHSFATVATAGFGTRNLSLSEFSATTQWTLVVFMVLAGMNYALMYRALLLRRLRVFLRDDEFRLYMALLALGAAVLFAELWSESLYRGEEAVRHAVFQAVSIMTTTGFASADFSKWTLLAGVTLVGLMFSGASAGSTSGSIKVVRHVLVGRILRRELDQTVHPELVGTIRLNDRVVDERTVRSVIVFVLLYIGIFGLGAFGIALESAFIDLNLSLLEAVAASATTLGGVGPGFGFAGPMGSFAQFGDGAKAIMVVLMWVGRIEIIPVAVLLTRGYWRV